VQEPKVSLGLSARLGLLVPKDRLDRLVRSDLQVNLDQPVPITSVISYALAVTTIFPKPT
jgi:hypothetical protein